MSTKELDELIELITYIKDMPAEQRKALLTELKGGQGNERAEEHNA